MAFGQEMGGMVLAAQPRWFLTNGAKGSIDFSEVGGQLLLMRTEPKTRPLVRFPHLACELDQFKRRNVGDGPLLHQPPEFCRGQNIAHHRQLADWRPLSRPRAKRSRLSIQYW